jgi:alkyl hydroperoxide reductase subunit D
MAGSRHEHRYRFTHLADGGEYRSLPARLRMNVIGNPGVDKVDFELVSLAVSAVNGCGMCVNAHDAVLKQHGDGREAIHAVAQVLAFERAA